MYISLIVEEQNDNLIWKDENNDVYTEKSS